MGIRDFIPFVKARAQQQDKAYTTNVGRGWIQGMKWEQKICIYTVYVFYRLQYTVYLKEIKIEFEFSSFYNDDGYDSNPFFANFIQKCRDREGKIRAIVDGNNFAFTLLRESQSPGINCARK